jgi:FimV-like protein
LTDRFLAHPQADIAILIVAVLLVAGVWLLVLARRGRRAHQRAAASVETPSRVVAPSSIAATDPPGTSRADPWLKMSELERAIGGRFDLPASLDMEPDDVQPRAAAAAAVAAAPAPAIPPAPSSLQPPARSADLGVNQRLAQSLEQAAACLRRNEIDEARRLLEDVIRSGDETQRDFARLLLSRLG